MLYNLEVVEKRFNFANIKFTFFLKLIYLSYKVLKN